MQDPNKTYANQLRRGTQLRSQASHHRGMAELLLQLGVPRPPGYTLSLIHQDSPGCYWGYVYRRGEKVPYLLSTDPADYAWETWSENHKRKPVGGNVGYSSPDEILQHGPEISYGKWASLNTTTRGRPWGS